jgi:hypothetical protein
MVQQKFENDLKRYFKEIKSLFPVYGEREKQFLANLMSDIGKFTGSNPISDYVQLISSFGEPKTIVSQYLAEADSDYLAKQIKTAKFVRIGVIAIIIAAVVVIVSVIAIMYVDFVKGQTQYLDREVTEFIE